MSILQRIPQVNINKTGITIGFVQGKMSGTMAREPGMKYRYKNTLRAALI